MVFSQYKPETMRASQAPFVSVVISNHNGYRMGILKDCLRSILELDYPNFEVILVDNASDDGSLEFVKTSFTNKRLVLIGNKENNYSKGLNYGIERKGSYIAYFNNDIEVDKLYLKEMISFLEANQKVGLAQGKLLSYCNHSQIDSVGETMDLFGNSCSIGGGETDHAQYEACAEMLSASGSACVIRRSVLALVGGYDPQYHIGYEDMDLALRVWFSGFSVMYIPKAKVYHMRGKTDLSNEVRLLCRYHFNKNRIATIIKNYDPRSMFVALAVLLLLYILMLFVEALKDKNALPLRIKSLFWNLKHLKRLYVMRRGTQRSMKMKFRDLRRLFLSSEIGLKASFLGILK